MDEIAPELDKYLPLLERESISEAEKRELLQTLFYILVDLVDLGIPIPPATSICGKIEKRDAIATKSAQNKVNCHYPFNRKFKSAARNPVCNVSAESDL